jgi:hypothetical protein
MAARKMYQYPPKAVEFHFDEKIPKRPAARRSRLVRDAPMATARLAVEELLCSHHGASEAAIRRLSPAAQKVLFRMVTDPADRDHVYRRDAVSALAVLGSRDAIVLLAALADDEREDPVIVGRALNGLARLGGASAAWFIERSLMKAGVKGARSIPTRNRGVIRREGQESPPGTGAWTRRTPRGT